MPPQAAHHPIARALVGVLLQVAKLVPGTSRHRAGIPRTSKDAGSPHAIITSYPFPSYHCPPGFCLLRITLYCIVESPQSSNSSRLEELVRHLLFLSPVPPTLQSTPKENSKKNHLTPSRLRGLLLASIKTTDIRWEKPPLLLRMVQQTPTTTPQTRRPLQARTTSLLYRSPRT